MEKLLANIALGYARHAVTGGGLVALLAPKVLTVTHGLLTSDQSTQAAGAVVTLIGLGLSAYDKYVSDKKAKPAAPSTPVDPALF